MNINLDTLEPMGLPMFIDRSTEILAWLKGKSKDELKELWKCNDKIVELKDLSSKIEYVFERRL